MKQFLPIILLVFLTGHTLTAQNRIMSDIEDGDYADAYEDLKEDYEEQSVFYNYLYAALYNERGFSHYDTEKAIAYLEKANKQYLYANSEEREDLRENKYPVNPSILRNLRIRICGNALEDAKKVNSLDEYQSYLQTYNECEQFEYQAKELRNEKAYELALSQNTLEAYQGFVDSYPEALQIKEITYLRDSMVYEQAAKKNTKKAYRDFLMQYPESKMSPKAKAALGELTYKEVMGERDEKKLAAFLKNNPDNPHRKEIEKRLYEVVTADGSARSYSRLINEYPENHMVSKACKKIYDDYYAFDGELYSIEKYGVIYPGCPNFPERHEDEQMAILAFNLGLTAEYNNFGGGAFRQVETGFYQKNIRTYIKKTGDVELAWVALLKIMKPDLDKGNWQSALDTLRAYKTYFTDEKLVQKINDLAAMLETQETEVKKQKLGAGVNTSKHEYIPVISFDGQQLFFCTKDRPGNIGGEDVFVADRQANNEEFGNARPFPDVNSANGNESPLSLSVDGTRLLIFQDGDIYESQKKSSGWEKPKRMPAPLNTGQWEADAMYSSDGQAIVFASSRYGGYNIHQEAKYYHGIRAHHSDLYVCLNENGEWDKVINLGPVINTPFSERQPYLHPDMKTMYFSSDGHYGMGDLDVYKTERIYDTSWAHWTEPVNVGKAINTTDGDWGYKINTTGEYAYYFSNKSGNYDIYRVELPESMRPENVAMIHGVVSDQDGTPVHAEMRWEDLETGEEIGKSYTDPEDGSFFIILPLERNYGYFVHHEDYFPEANTIDLRQENRMITREENIELLSLESLFAEGRTIPIDNVFFEHDKAQLKPESYPQLNRLARIVKQLHGMTVEISGHTDNTGNDAYNMDLSARRAAAVRDYLIEQGCEGNLLKSKGYGETKPIATNETEEGRALNRRVEFGFAE